MDEEDLQDLRDSRKLENTETFKTDGFTSTADELGRTKYVLECTVFADSTDGLQFHRIRPYIPRPTRNIVYRPEIVDEDGMATRTRHRPAGIGEETQNSGSQALGTLLSTGPGGTGRGRGRGETHVCA